MRFQGALIREQGQEFAVVVVKRHVIGNRSEAQSLIMAWSREFGIPVVLMAQDSFGTPTYFGRPDIVRFLANVPLAAIPWKEFSMT